MAGILPGRVGVRGSNTLHYWPDPRLATVAAPDPDAGNSTAPTPDSWPALAPSNWRLTYDAPNAEDIWGSPPLIAQSTLVAPFTGEHVLVLDATLPPTAATTLTPDRQSFPAASFVVPISHTMLPSAGDLLDDIDAPWVRPGGRGGDYTRTHQGDYLRAGGRATIEKLIWTQLLTPQGAWDWAPNVGTVLGLKALEPAQLRAEERRIARLLSDIPGISSASATLRFQDDHAVIALRAQTDFGALTTAREIL